NHKLWRGNHDFIISVVMKREVPLLHRQYAPAQYIRETAVDLKENHLVFSGKSSNIAPAFDLSGSKTKVP
ncbi:hypothetical protein, partial [Proteiniphilum sp. UBA1028]|uniref:hypothetical protein n=1 Tax=Proteiniphilum sp. UBA1028 TaxID=1947251 RepID=UPI0025E58DE5